MYLESAMQTNTKIKHTHKVVPNEPVNWRRLQHPIWSLDGADDIENTLTLHQ